jgi:protein-L-isoaspartate(D-aspartate) O-methyltransferase
MAHLGRFGPAGKMGSNILYSGRVRNIDPYLSAVLFCCDRIPEQRQDMSDNDNQADDVRRLTNLRAFFARFVAVYSGASDPRIEEAFASVPREQFAGPGPWSILAIRPSRDPAYVRTPDSDPAFLYQNVLVALDEQRGINIGEPGYHAHWIDSLRLKPGETVLQVGAGSGYYSAILAHIVGSRGRVHAFEIDSALAERARCNVVHWPQITIEARSGTVEGLPEADAIYVNAGITQPCRAWLDALRPGGRVLFPLQPERMLGGMLLIEKPSQEGSVWPARFISRARFVSCQGPQDAELGRSLAKTFAAGGAGKVKSIHFGDQPDGTCWFNGGEWWLSAGSV